jgi:uncharacterized protein (TIGR02145 family)
MKTLSFLILLILIGCSKEPLFTDDGIFTDYRDNHDYKWVQIGDQVWMAENLAWLPSVSPSSVGSAISPTYYVLFYQGYEVDVAKASSKYKTYGVLYNWVAARTACPENWHLPADEEWKVLEMYLGMSQPDADAMLNRISGLVGIKLKSTSGWKDPKKKHTSNSSGFTALPGDWRYFQDWTMLPGGFASHETDAYFWSASEVDSLRAWSRNLNYLNDGVNRENNLGKEYGFSVRCIKTAIH